MRLSVLNFNGIIYILYTPRKKILIVCLLCYSMKINFISIHQKCEVIPNKVSRDCIYMHLQTYIILKRG